MDYKSNHGREGSIHIPWTDQAVSCIVYRLIQAAEDKALRTNSVLPTPRNNQEVMPPPTTTDLR